MAIPSFLAADATTKQFPASVRAQMAANLGDASTEEGQAVRAAVGALGSTNPAEALVYAGQVPRPRMDTPPLRAVGKPVGVGAAAASNPGAGYAVGEELTIAGGTIFGTAAAAVLRVASVNGSGQITGMTVLNPSAYAAAPANPASVASSTGAGLGATFTLSTGTASASIAGRGALRVAPNDGRFAVLGMPLANINSSGYYGQSTQNGTHVVIGWQTDATKFAIRGLGLNTNAALFVDGVEMDLAGLRTDASGAGYLWALDFGGVRRMRSFKLYSVNTAFGGLDVPADAAVLTAPVTGRKLAYWLGDSYDFGTGAETIASQSSVVAADALGVDILPDGVGGAGWTASTLGSALDRINAKVPNLIQVPDIFVWDLGYNNASTDLTAVASAMDAAIARSRVLAPNAQHVGFGPATPQGQTAQLNALRDVMRARFAANAVPFVDVTDWVNAANKGIYTLSSDNVHPTPLGHKYLGAQKAIAARPLLTV